MTEPTPPASLLNLPDRVILQAPPVYSENQIPAFPEDLAQLRAGHPELAHWTDLELYEAWGDYCQTSYKAGWLGVAAPVRDTEFLQLQALRTLWPEFPGEQEWDLMCFDFPAAFTRQWPEIERRLTPGQPR